MDVKEGGVRTKMKCASGVRSSTKRGTEAGLGDDGKVKVIAGKRRAN